MDHLKHMREIEEKWEQHRKVLREMGWQEERINTFLDKAKTALFAVEIKNNMERHGEE